MHDVFSAEDMAHDQLEHLRNIGVAYDPKIDEAYQRLAAAHDEAGLWCLFDFAQGIAKLHEDPSQWELSAIESRMKSEKDRFESAKSSLWENPESVRQRIAGAWFGRCVACCMGKPVEGMTKEQVRDYLHHADAWPLRGYVPLTDYLPAGVTELNPSAPFSTLNNVVEMPRDDDTDYTILGLHMLERHGKTLTSELIARDWFDLLPFYQTFTAERATYKNLVEGDKPPEAADRRNPYVDWIGALIRADIYGYVFPAAPYAAMEAAYPDATLTHRGEGIYGELWAAAMISLSFVEASIVSLVKDSLDYIPQDSELYAAVSRMIDMHEQGRSWEDAITWIDETYADFSWVHTVNNAALISAALLWGDEDYAKTAGLAVQAGYDTDSSAATVGSIMGAYLGAENLPDSLVSVLHDTIRSAVHGYDRSSISQLAQRTFMLADAWK